MEDGVIVVFCPRLHRIEHQPRRTLDVFEVAGVAGEPPAVTGVVLPFTPPEVGRIGGERAGVVDLGDDVIAPDDERGPAGGGRVLERVAGSTLRHVRTDGDPERDHPALDHAHAGLDACRPRLARELVVGGGHVRGRPDRLADRAGRGLDRVGVRLAPHIDGADGFGVDGSSPESGACRLNGDRCCVFIEIGDGFLKDPETSHDVVCIAAPYPCDLRDFYPVSRDVDAV